MKAQNESWRAVDGRYHGFGIAHMTDGAYGEPYKVAAIYGIDDPIAGDRCIALVNGKSTGEVDANARLIAAAPEMQTVLRLVASLLPVAARLHPDDLAALQKRVICAIKDSEPML